MKKTKLGSILCVCLISLLSFSEVSIAAEHSVQVSYTPSFEELAPTEVKVIVSVEMNKLGKILDGDEELDAGETLYNLRYGEAKVFCIRPVLGYDVDKVMYDGENITNLLKASKARSIKKEYFIEITGKGHDAKLEVTYKKIDDSKPIDPEQPIEPDKPDNPGNPGNIEEPIIQDGSSSSSITVKAPNTGLSVNYYGFITVISMFVVVIIATLLKKRKKKDEDI